MVPLRDRKLNLVKYVQPGLKVAVSSQSHWLKKVQRTFGELLNGAANGGPGSFSVWQVIRSRVSAALQSLRNGSAALDLSPNRLSYPSLAH
jgi:hypothetical protein